MTVERSHGKARPTLVRASDLTAPDTVVVRSDGRAPDGRFAAGNRASIGRGFRMAIRKLLGPPTVGPEARMIRADAWRVFTATMAVMPSDAAPVRAMVGLHAGHVALAAFYRELAAVKGLDTPAGLEMLAVSDRQSQRAERVLVTAMDVARVCAEREARSSRGGKPTWLAAMEADREDADGESK